MTDVAQAETIRFQTVMNHKPVLLAVRQVSSHIDATRVNYIIYVNIDEPAAKDAKITDLHLRVAAARRTGHLEGSSLKFPAFFDVWIVYNWNPFDHGFFKDIETLLP